MKNKKNMLVAVVYETGSGADTDRLLTSVADALLDRGLKVAGTVQRAFERADRCACDMVVRDLATNSEVKISEDRGPNARGCRLDPAMLEALVGSTAAALAGDIDILILNKFGKQEAVGAGFRDVIAQALADEVPILIGVNAAYLDSWRAFAGEFADELPPDAVSLRLWLAERLSAPGLKEADGCAANRPTGHA